jgi:hypothetical protein
MTLATPEDTPISFTLAGSDVDAGDLLTYHLSSAPAVGVVSGVAPNLTYAPKANASGTVTFTYVATDRSGASASATVTIAVNSVDDLPVAGSGGVTTPEDTAKAIALTGTDAEGGVTITVTTPPAHGTYAGGTYTPALNFNGVDAIGFTVKDGANQTTTGTIVITVTPVNDPPVALDTAKATTRTVPVAIPLGATDVDGAGTLTFTIVSGPTKGTLSGTAPALTYTPTGFNTGNDSFTFRVTDSGGASDTGTATIAIGAGGALPTVQVVAPATVTKPGGLLGVLQQYTFNNLRSTLKTTGGLPVPNVSIQFTVDGKKICAATTNASGVATCTAKGPRKDTPLYVATFAGNAAFAASTGTGALS